MPITDIKFTNNARTLLSTSSLADDATSVSVDDGSVFPSLSSGHYFYATLERASDSTTREIVKVTARSGNDLTIVRAQDNTSATTFSADDIIELRVVAKALEDIRDAVITQEEVEDHVGGMLDGTETFIDVSYDDTDGNIDFVVPVKDEDNMASNSATHLATQQSIKAYVDDKVSTTTLTLYKYTATAGQTTFTGSDDSSATLAYTANALFVTLNGVVLENGTDYTATNGTSVVLTDAATVGDELNIYAFGTFTVTSVSGDFSIGDDLTLGSDAAVINMGADNDVTLTHVADTGVTLSAGTNDTVLQIDSNNADAGSAPKLVLNRTTDSPADNDQGGVIKFDMENDNNQQFNAANIFATATDVSDTTEDSSLHFQTITAGSSADALVLAGGRISSSAYSPAGSIVQVVTSSALSGNTNATSDSDITNASVAITPASSSNKIFVIANVDAFHGLVAGVNQMYTQTLYKTVGGSDTALNYRYLQSASGSGGLQSYGSLAHAVLDAPSTTSEITYKIKHKVSNTGGYGGVTAGSYIIAMEVQV